MFIKSTISLLMICQFASIDVWAISSDELADQVTIRRTEYGVPHILAENDRALGFGLGYAQAEDHMVTIMKLILTSRGEKSKYFGATDSNIKSDLWYKQYRVRERAKETYTQLDSDWRAATEGFAAGLNFYIANHREELPLWVQPVSPIDVATHGLAGVSRFSLNRGRIVDRLLDKLKKGETGIVDPDEDMGSNMWSFSGEKTKSGNAILMGNPHQSWSEVATYYEAHVTIPGKLNFYGSTFIGRPVLTTGFNEHLGWTHTVNYPDIEEIYALDRDSNWPEHYVLDGQSHPMTSEEIQVEYRDENGMPVTIEKTFFHTELGPVVHISDDLIYVHRPAAYFEFRFYQQWYRMNHATTWAEWREAFDELIMPMFNTGYADDKGNIYYRWNGTVPELPNGSHGDAAVHVTKSDEIWSKFHSSSELPQVFNPKGGYLMNSNSTPYHTTLHEVMDRDSFPDYFPDARFSFRSQHSIHLIHNDDKYSLEDVVNMKFSQRAVTAERIKDDLLNALEGVKLSDLEKNGVKLLSDWNNTTTRDSRGSVLFQEWLNRYRKGKQTADLFAIPWDYDNPITTPDGLSDLESAIDSYKAAVDFVQDTHGDIAVKWGDVHRIQFGDKVDLPIAGAGGDMGSFRVLGYRDGKDNKKVARTGDSWVFAVEFGEQPEAYSVVAYSQSGKEESPHFADQASLFADNKMKKAAFLEKDIQKKLLKSYHPGEE
jgi:acyl-homoserine-lactone acylase